MNRFGRSLLAMPVAAALALGSSASVARGEPETPFADAPWRWPVAAVRIVEPYVQPAHRYAPGHRGIDLGAPVGSVVIAPASGVVAFAGTVAGRAIVTVDHGEGLVTTLEPVDADLAPGDAVKRGDRLGVVAEGGHTIPDAVHFGVRLDGEYINPLVLLGGVPRAILLPCCD